MVSQGERLMLIDGELVLGPYSSTTPHVVESQNGLAGHLETKAITYPTT